MAEQVVELIPEESKLVSFEAVPHEAKTYQVSVNGLRGSFAVTTPPPFTFSNVTAEKVGCEAAPAFGTVNFGCRITNSTGQPITRKLKVMWAYGDIADMIKKFTGEVGISFELTLAPNEHSDYYLAGNYQEAGERYCHVLVFMNSFVCMWLEDEDGNKSPEGCVYR